MYQGIAWVTCMYQGNAWVTCMYQGNAWVTSMCILLPKMNHLYFSMVHTLILPAIHTILVDVLLMALHTRGLGKLLPRMLLTGKLQQQVAI